MKRVLIASYVVGEVVLSIPLRMKPSLSSFVILLGVLISLSIPLRMKRSRKIITWTSRRQTPTNFQFLWGWNSTCLPIRSSYLCSTFNSFEDETWFVCIVCFRAYKLSIPLRMKQTPKNTKNLIEACFQFLWGWNKRLPQAEIADPISTFNSFEDET